MLSQVTLILLVCCLSTSTIPITIYKNAQFVPTNTNLKLADQFSINSLNECACQCLNNSQCLTATYIGINKSCSMFSAQVKRSWLQIQTTIMDASVLTFSNESLPVCSTYNFQQPPQLYTTGALPAVMISADLNKDGHVDLAIGNYNGNSISILLGIGNGSFQLPAISFPSNGSNPYWFVAHDFNNDGNIDLAICNEGSNTISILLGLGNGSFQLSVITFNSGGSAPSSIIVVDVNNDYKADLVVTNTGSYTITIFLGFNNGTFQVPGTSYAAGSSPSSITSGDFNSDGNIDLAVVSRNSNQLLIFRGVGNGTFQTNVTSYTTGSVPYLVRTADFNGDSKLDLLVANSYSNTISIFTGTGVGTFVTSASATYTTGIANTFDIAIQDLNGDLIMDLAVSNQYGNISVYFGYQNGTFGGIKSYSSAGQLSKGITITDFNEDGRPDLAIANGNSNTVAIILALCT
ncbi:unnamed protein product [Adineta steineri]|uniref:Apple domain-containing protein n=1 Tax=Adineta steineri TaxID=433720 RepID=A0A819KJK3_9BILA|nr:unnamed protein product [Adineta steineri]CAF1447181.1 unnamed protein product [Adineta steineri]CAF3950470.1 unnamed protein product [Adineta steineri]CAF3978631.1 unnamed protein product [Adineta steineri]